jgi:hypothetical protein
MQCGHYYKTAIHKCNLDYQSVHVVVICWKEEQNTELMEQGMPK